MAQGILSEVLHYLRRRYGGAGPGEGADDAELLRRFAVSRDEAAFAALVARHGPIVWGVCRRLLANPHDAEDAFQAVFLVLVRKGRGLLRPDLVGPWLHAVALRVTSRLRETAARRRDKERPLVEEPAMESTPDLVWRDLRPVLDEEVGRLPPRYRAAFVLCHLEGLTNEAAARRLCCPKGTVLSRLARARELLRRRLARRGVALSAGALAAALAVRDCSAAAPAALAESTVRLGLAFAAGGASALSVKAAALAQGVLKSMFLTQIKTVVAVLLTLCIAGAGMGLAAFGASRPRPSSAAPAAQDSAPVADQPAPPPTADGDKKPAPEKHAQESQARLWREQMDEPNNLEIPPHPDLTLGDVLDLFEMRYGLHFEVNERAFANDAGGGMADVLGYQVAQMRPLPKMKNVSVATALRMVLDRLPIPALAVIRKDTVEITTVNDMRAELGYSEDRPLLPLVWEEMDDMPLPRALQQLARASGMNVVVDPRALTEDGAKLKVTVQFANVPVDSAVRILANMADLQALRIDNVLYVTTAKRAAQLQAERAHNPTEDALPKLRTPRQ
ncbi:MAG TPA: sigma-70 family RNA polymerase sigma factor [Gemmataceae bacterium]|nr:sigma-70 family RNA polymerase sigma factor [Gemmataceae bacterium]